MQDVVCYEAALEDERVDIVVNVIAAVPAVAAVCAGVLKRGLHVYERV